MSELRRSRRTKFIADENIEPWALHVMRYGNFDVLSCDRARMRGKDDRAVFATAWRLRRVLITHDEDFLDDRSFPFFRCSGLVVFPNFPKQSRNYSALLQRTLNVIRRGSHLWLHTKMIATRDFNVIVRTWDKSEGRIVRFTADLG